MTLFGNFGWAAVEEKTSIHYNAITKSPMKVKASTALEIPQGTLDW